MRRTARQPTADGGSSDWVWFLWLEEEGIIDAGAGVLVVVVKHKHRHDGFVTAPGQGWERMFSFNIRSTGPLVDVM